jgi:hypothetical protein
VQTERHDREGHGEDQQERPDLRLRYRGDDKQGEGDQLGEPVDAERPTDRRRRRLPPPGGTRLIAMDLDEVSLRVDFVVSAPRRARIPATQSTYRSFGFRGRIVR